MPGARTFISIAMRRGRRTRTRIRKATRGAPWGSACCTVWPGAPLSSCCWSRRRPPRGPARLLRRVRDRHDDRDARRVGLAREPGVARFDPGRALGDAAPSRQRGGERDGRASARRASGVAAIRRRTGDLQQSMNSYAPRSHSETALLPSRLLVCTMLALWPALASAQDSVPDTTPFHAHQWAAQFGGGAGFASLGALRFTAPTRAWLVDFRFTGGHSHSRHYVQD